MEDYIFVQDGLLFEGLFLYTTPCYESTSHRLHFDFLVIYILSLDANNLYQSGIWRIQMTVHGSRSLAHRIGMSATLYRTLAGNGCRFIITTRMTMVLSPHTNSYKTDEH
jgi:hypothetical protein